MKGDELLDAIGDIDPKYIDEASKKPHRFKRKAWTAAISIAACFCLIIGAKVALNNNAGSIQPDDSTLQSAESGENSTDSDNKEDSNYGANKKAKAKENEDDKHSGKQELITGFGENSCDSSLTVQNGDEAISESLQNSLDDFVDDAEYVVVIKLFKDDSPVDSSYDKVKLECDNLRSQGFKAFVVKHKKGSKTYNYIVVRASYDEVYSLYPSEDNGYYILLYDEIFNSED